jgi:zinc/manganese transport system substrate-binding protein
MTRITCLLLGFLFAWIAPAGAKPLEIVASFSILGDMTERVGGEDIKLTVLIGPDGDAHGFEPTPADARRLAAADIILANGLGFEPWLKRLAQSSAAKAPIIEVSKSVKPLPLKHAGHGHSHAHKHNHDGGFDPHAWQDARNAVVYVSNIAGALAKADPANAAAYRSRAKEYEAELRLLDADIRKSLSAIPQARRRVITSHDAFGYFGSAYGVTFLAPLGTSTEAQASAKGVARLIEQIRREKIRTLFVENITDPRLIEQIARETGARIGGQLYSDALSDARGPAPTYIGMMRHNTRLLTGAMAEGS